MGGVGRNGNSTILQKSVLVWRTQRKSSYNSSKANKTISRTPRPNVNKVKKSIEIVRPNPPMWEMRHNRSSVLYFLPSSINTPPQINTNRKIETTVSMSMVSLVEGCGCILPNPLYHRLNNKSIHLLSKIHHTTSFLFLLGSIREA